MTVDVPKKHMRLHGFEQVTGSNDVGGMEFNFPFPNSVPHLYLPL